MKMNTVHARLCVCVCVYRDILQKLQIEASVCQESLQKALEDTVEQQRCSCEAVAEREKVTNTCAYAHSLIQPFGLSHCASHSEHP